MSNENEILETVKNIKKEIKDVSVNGLHEVYEGKFTDYLYDFYPNFSWNDNDVKEMLILIVDKEFIENCKLIKEKYNFDLINDLKETIKERNQDKRDSYKESQDISKIIIEGKLLTTVTKPVGSSGQISIGTQHAGKNVTAYVILTPE